MGLKETLRGLGCMAKGLGCLIVIGVVVGIFYLLFGLFLLGTASFAEIAYNFYWDHCGIIWSIIGVVVVLWVANAIGKDSD